jgi:hypothetical protein
MIKTASLKVENLAQTTFGVSLVSLFGYNFINMKKALKHKIQEGL